MKTKIYLPPKHHIPILEDPINYYYFPLFSSFFIKRLELVMSFVQGEKLGKVLDLGCGAGILLAELYRRSEIVFGVDTFLQEYSLKKMIKQEAISAHLAWADIRALPFKNETFNTIICISTLEHIKELVQALNDIKRILKPRGKLLAGFPAQNFFTDRLLGGSTEFHVSSHKTILQAAEKVFSIIKVKHFPFIFPMNYSFYCAFAGRKI